MYTRILTSLIKINHSLSKIVVQDFAINLSTALCIWSYTCFFSWKPDFCTSEPAQFLNCVVQNEGRFLVCCYLFHCKIYYIQEIFICACISICISCCLFSKNLENFSGRSSFSIISSSCFTHQSRPGFKPYQLYKSQVFKGFN